MTSQAAISACTPSRSEAGAVSPSSMAARLRRGLRRAALLLLAPAIPSAPAWADPDLGWGTAENLVANPSNITTHKAPLAAYGSDGTAWVYFRQDP